MVSGIGVAEVQRLIAAGAQVVEVLPEDKYAKLHLPGAINLPLKQLTAERAGELDRKRATVLYCWDSL